jgi:arylsulfatase
MSITRRGFLAAASGAAGAFARPAPNVVLFFCDDLGYGDLGCYGGALSTPNIDRLAREGMRFTDAVSANPVCSPSRAALLTGRYPTRAGVPNVLFPRDEKGMPLEEVTLADVLKAKGYKTGCVGKWHLGHKPGYLPTRRGFDSYFGIPYSNDMKPAVVMDNEAVSEPEATQDTLTERYTQRAVKFIDDHASNPFFLYFPHTFPHIPLFAGKRFRGKSAHGIYGDVMAEVDWSVGEVMAALKRHRLDRDTLVLFSSDNGPWYQGTPGPLRGRKGMTWEGGVRVPFIARQPGTVKPGASDTLVSLMDVMPTVAAHCGAELKSRVDGMDIGAILRGTKKQVERDVLLYFDAWNLQCVRRGEWKLHLARYNNVTYSPAPAGGRFNLPLARPELYNLKTDPAESYDVAAEHPEIVQQIRARAEELLKDLPEEARRAYAETLKRPATVPPAGSLPQRRGN